VIQTPVNPGFVFYNVDNENCNIEVSMVKATAMMICTVLLLQGCSGSSVKQQATVTSTPAGAIVYANGQKLGVTPLHYNLYKAFPVAMKKLVISATGVLKVKKEGCEDFTLEINDYILSKPIHADLKCSELTKPEKMAPVVHEKKQPMVAPVEKPLSAIEKRLAELEALYKKGAITADEYKATRKRILNEL
jgi:hypothetical protein